MPSEHMDIEVLLHSIFHLYRDVEALSPPRIDDVQGNPKILELNLDLASSTLKPASKGYHLSLGIDSWKALYPYHLNLRDGQCNPRPGPGPGIRTYSIQM